MNAPRRPARSLLTPSFIEQLEPRQLLAVGLTGGVLTVTGGSRADNIKVSAAGTQVKVKLNSGAVRSFTRSAVQQLVINGGSGNDKINVTGGFDDVIINGGGGNDRINGSGGGDWITGGGGNDIIKGRNGDDQIYGDNGDDNLSGGNGNDTLGGDDEDNIVPATGGVGDDTLSGGAGDDWLLMGQDSDADLEPQTAGTQAGISDPSGNDQLSGGAGNDVVDIRGRDAEGFEDGSNGTITQTDPTDIIPVDDVADDFTGNDVTNNYSHHKHAFLILKINGQTITIGDGAGQFGGAPVVHTHEAPTPLDVRGNLIHFHNTPNSGGPSRVLTLGDFFQHWGISFSSKNIGRFRVDKDHELVMSVKPKGSGGFVNNTQFSNYAIQTDDNQVADSTKYDQIIIEYKHK